MRLNSHSLAPQLALGHVKTSTSFEFQSSVIELRILSQQGQKSLQNVTSLLVESGESQEDHQGPWDFVSSRHWDLLVDVRHSLYEDRQGFVVLNPSFDDDKETKMQTK